MSTDLQPKAILMNMLFVASGPVQLSRLAKAIDLPTKRVGRILDELENDIVEHGLRLQRTDQGVQLTSAAQAGKFIEEFLGLENRTRLSGAAVEVLSIIAYSQPVTRPQVDQIRGVNSDGSLRKLLTFGLIEEVGRLDTPGRPILYGTTAEFLQEFGLNNLDELPELPIDKIEDSQIEESIAGNEEKLLIEATDKDENSPNE